MDVAVFGLNPSWQKVLSIAELIPGAVHRALSRTTYASGKGINCARVLARLGDHPLLLQFAGGETGRMLVGEIEAAGLQHLTIPVSGETRTCTTVIDAGGMATEFIEPADAAGSGAVESLLESREWRSAQGIAICGTVPPGFPMERLAAALGRLSLGRLWVDSYRDAAPLLELPGTVVKLNREEVLSLSPVGMDLDSAAKWLFSRYPVDRLVCTDGADRVFAWSRGHRWSLQVPKVDRLVNPIGAGDTFLAGWIHAERAGWAPGECLAAAASLASAKCETLLPWTVSLERAEQLYAVCLDRLESSSWS